MNKKINIKELKIKDAAHNFAINGRYSCYKELGLAESNKKLGFITGAHSEEAKELWQDGMYSEDEVKALVDKAIYDYIGTNGTIVENNLKISKLWFDTHKKQNNE